MDWLAHPNAQWVFLGSVLLGISSGILSSFAMLRRRSLMGDALAHAALPGICAAFLISSGNKSLLLLMAGALIAGLLGALCIQMITRYSRIKEDTALGLVLSVFYAFGIVLLTFILKSDMGNQAGLDKFLFGQSAAMVSGDVKVMAICAGIVILLTFLLYKELKLLCFDAGFASSIGFHASMIDALLNLLLVVVVVIGLQAVGVILMVAMLITPAAAARFWTDRLNRMVVLSAVIGGLSGALGTYMSTQQEHLPTGPLIVLTTTSLFVVSLLLAPGKGVVAKLFHLWGLRRRVARENLLRSFYEWSEINGEWVGAVSLDEWARFRNEPPERLQKQIQPLIREGLAWERPQGIELTPEGQLEAYRITRNHRLWEIYLMHEEQIGAEDVDHEADRIEHFLTADSVQELERLLQMHGRDLKLPPSVHPVYARAT